MVRHLAITINNRTSIQIRFSHQAFIDLIPPHHTTPTKAIPSQVQLSKLVAHATLSLQNHQILEIKFKQAKLLTPQRKFSRVSLEYLPSSSSLPNGQTSPHEPEPEPKPDLPDYQIYQTVCTGLLSS